MRDLLSTNWLPPEEPEIARFVAQSTEVYHWLRNPSSLDCAVAFTEAVRTWVETGRANRIAGLLTFDYAAAMGSPFQAIDAFVAMIKDDGRRLRFFRGEHPYVQDLTTAPAIEDEPIAVGDALVVSLPFAGHGGVPGGLREVLGACARLGVPVLVDASLLGLASGFSFDLSHESVVAVVFSPSTSLGARAFPSAALFSKIVIPAAETRLDWADVGGLNLRIGIHLMKSFDAGWLNRHWTGAQTHVCRHYGIDPSPCAHIAIGGDGWEAFVHDGLNRIAIEAAIRDVIDDIPLPPQE